MLVSTIIDLVTHRLTKHLTLVITGNIFAAFLGFLAILTVSRGLTVHDFGLFNIAISAMLIASRLSSLGMETSMIKFASSYLGADKEAEATQVFRATFLVRILFSFILFVIIFNTAELLSTKVFHDSGLTPLLKLTAFGVLSISTWFHLKSALYTYRLFQMGVIVQNLIDCGKLLTVIILVFYLKMNAVTAVAAFVFTPLIGVLLGFGKFYRELFRKRGSLKNQYSKLFSYSKWLFVSNICGLTLPYVGVFMLAKILGGESAGIYGLALRLVYIFPIINYSLQAVLLPEVSRFKEITQLEKYIKGSLKISFCIGITIIPLIFLSPEIILFFFGPRYLGSIPIFNWLLLGYIFLIFNNTISVALHAINKPHIIAMTSLIKLTVMVTGCYLLIPFFGVLVPAILALIINVSVLGFLSMYVFKKIREGNISFQHEEVNVPYSD